ncbi:MAG: aminotransferase class III-fold pyridoxal phosphate-dependent enzyme [Planctomycetota bacterium]|nr:aminotransferase class III-fold pyridoxal phosphate-dependent enzyme [Planctomycetota bacterium]
MPTEKAVRVPDTDHRPAAYTGPPKDEVVTLRQQYLTPGLLRYYREPLLIVEGHMQYVWDETGKQYLDAFAGVVTISAGHCHPDIIQQVRAQAKQLQHTTTLYLHPTVGQLGKAVAEHMPADSGLSVSYFTNSGSEANEIALLSAREFTGHADVLSLHNSYHGGTQGAMSMTAVGTWKFAASPAVNIKHAAPGYCYRCPYGLEYPDCDIKCARDVEMLIRHETSGQVACRGGRGGLEEVHQQFIACPFEVTCRLICRFCVCNFTPKFVDFLTQQLSIRSVGIHQSTPRFNALIPAPPNPRQRFGPGSGVILH